MWVAPHRRLVPVLQVFFYLFCGAPVERFLALHTEGSRCFVIRAKVRPKIQLICCDLRDVRIDPDSWFDREERGGVGESLKKNRGLLDYRVQLRHLGSDPPRISGHLVNELPR